MNYQNRTYDIIAVRRVIRNLQSNDPAEIKQGIDSSASFGGNEDICNALIPLLRHTDGDMRARTIMALGHVLHPNCIRHLELALADPLPKVRSTSIDALARLKALHSAPKIAAMLGDRSPEVRYSACEAIGTLKYTHAAPYIVSLLNDSEDIVRLGAAESLGYLGLPAAAPALMKALNDEFHLVRAYAAESLGRIGNPAAKNVLKQRLAAETASRARLGLHTALYRLGDVDELPKIVSFLNDQNPLARRTAASTIVELSDQSTSGSLLVTLQRALQNERQRQTREALQTAVKILRSRTAE